MDNTNTNTNATAILEGKNYRIRRLLITLDLDVYDNAGLLLNRGKSDEIVIPEASFPGELVKILADMTGLAKGFVTMTPADGAPTP